MSDVILSYSWSRRNARAEKKGYASRDNLELIGNNFKLKGAK